MMSSLSTSVTSRSSDSPLADLLNDGMSRGLLMTYDGRLDSWLGHEVHFSTDPSWERIHG